MSPVILLGMHRSGTSLLTRMLSELGLFVGKDLQDDHESVFFIRCNDLILRQGGATWDHPEIFSLRMADSSQRRALADRLKVRLTYRNIRRYTGPVRESAFRERRTFDFHWGWKDPRSTFTLPVWLDLYPDARIVHISRHGVDVAQSLCVREGRLVQRIKTAIKAAAIIWPRSTDGRLANLMRCTTLDGAFSLWESYMCQARSVIRLHGDRAKDVCYEDFLERPIAVLENICQFIDLPFEAGRLQALVGTVNRQRAYAYREDPRLLAFSDAHRQRLALFGY